MLLEFWDTILFEVLGYTMTVGRLVIFVGVVLAALLFEWIGRRLLKRRERFQKLMKEAGVANLWLSIFRYGMYLGGLYLAFRLIGLDILSIPLITMKRGEGTVDIRGADLVMSLLILLAGRVVLIYAKINLTKEKGTIPQGVEDKRKIRRKMAVFQILRYVVYVTVAILILTNLQLNLNFLLASSAALFVGVGLALQGTFSDIASGIIILFEGTIEVGDMIFIDSLSLEGKVTDIRLRTTIVETLDNMSVIVPNSQFTNTNVVNWSYSTDDTRFRLKVGVAYGSDVSKVRTVLKDCASAHQRVLKSPPPKVRFVEFGDSSLNFELLFWTRFPVMYEDILSDLHFKVDSEFRKNNINIPFPQRDLHIKSTELGKILNEKGDEKEGKE
ncbi:MAG: mechanosensitive ion channel [Bacteroidia bacterium]|nr:mechanosensitive ion channel [Bacteroidia bacterium]